MFIVICVVLIAVMIFFGFRAIQRSSPGPMIQQGPPVYYDDDPMYVASNPVAEVAAFVATEVVADAVMGAVEGAFDGGFDGGGFDGGGFDGGGFDGGGFGGDGGF